MGLFPTWTRSRRIMQVKRNTPSTLVIANGLSDATCWEYIRNVTNRRSDLVSDEVYENTRRGYVKRHMVDVITSRNSEEGIHSPNWPNGLIIINIIRTYS
jgi:hypothetical protein